MNKDNIFMNIVYTLANLSLDNKTHIGAIIVLPGSEIIVSTGYNSFPRSPFSLKKVEDKPERQERPIKYEYFLHAESAAIVNAAFVGNSVSGCTLYTTGIPCTSCTRNIIQSGIAKVVVDDKWKNLCSNKWIKEAKISEEMFRESGIIIREVKVELTSPVKFMDGIYSY